MSDEVVPGMADALERRRLMLGLGKGKLAAAAGVARETLRPVLAGYRRSYNDDTIFGVARALRWEVDWYDRLLAGEAPIENGAPTPAVDEIRALRAEVADLRARLELVDRRTRQDMSEGAPRADGAGS